MALAFVGPSYQLSTRRADVQRSINLVPTLVESGSGKAAVFLESVPGLRVFPDHLPDPCAERPAAVGGGCTAVFRDTFTDTAGTSLAAHTPDLAPTGFTTYTVVSARPMTIDSSGTQAYAEFGRAAAVIGSTAGGTPTLPLPFPFRVKLVVRLA